MQACLSTLLLYFVLQRHDFFLLTLYLLTEFRTCTLFQHVDFLLEFVVLFGQLDHARLQVVGLFLEDTNQTILLLDFTCRYDRAVLKGVQAVLLSMFKS